MVQIQFVYNVKDKSRVRKLGNDFRNILYYIVLPIASCILLNRKCTNRTIYSGYFKFSLCPGAYIFGNYQREMMLYNQNSISNKINFGTNMAISNTIPKTEKATNLTKKEKKKKCYGINIFTRFRRQTQCIIIYVRFLLTTWPLGKYGVSRTIKYIFIITIYG